jgi:hypothetical protein
MNPAPLPSIHHRRRWYYALWVALLLLSAASLYLWERPAAQVQASLLIRLRVRGAPAGTQFQAWAGPAARWAGPAWKGEAAFAQGPLPGDGFLPFPVLRVPIARRRWVRDYIPRRTWDLVMIRVVPPGAPPRYLALPLGTDIRTGLLRPGWKLSTTIDISFDKLGIDGKASSGIP